MPAKPKLPPTIEASHARIRSLEATLRQRLDPPCYVRYLVGRLVPQVGISDVVNTIGGDVDAAMVRGWLRGRPVQRRFLQRRTVYRLEIRLWEITRVTELRGGEEREQDDTDDTFRGVPVALHRDGGDDDMAATLAWLYDPKAYESEEAP